MRLCRRSAERLNLGNKPTSALRPLDAESSIVRPRAFTPQTHACSVPRSANCGRLCVPASNPPSGVSFLYGSGRLEIAVVGHARCLTVPVVGRSMLGGGGELTSISRWLAWGDLAQARCFGVLICSQARYSLLVRFTLGESRRRLQGYLRSAFVRHFAANPPADEGPAAFGTESLEAVEAMVSRCARVTARHVATPLLVVGARSPRCQMCAGTSEGVSYSRGRHQCDFGPAAPDRGQKQRVPMILGSHSR